MRSAVALVLIPLFAGCPTSGPPRADGASSAQSPSAATGPPSAQPSPAATGLPSAQAAASAQAAPTKREHALLLSIAREIEALAPSCRRLDAFHARTAFVPEQLLISYQRRVHEPTRRAGWAGGVPNPDPDGIWLYIDIHDASSTAQIHTQPGGVPRFDLGGGRRLMLLMLEGELAPRCGERINAIVARQATAWSSAGP